jgi:class 3 adenylate cyclase
LAFQKRAADTFRRGGGTVTGSDADVLTVCFGSPLERESLAGKKSSSPYENNIYAKAAPALAAVDLVSEIARRPEFKSWHFGLDIGNCSFAWTALSGYFSLGHPVQKAKVLSRLAGRYNSRIVLSSAAREALPELAVKKLDVIKGRDETASEPFYQLAANVG